MGLVHISHLSHQGVAYAMSFWPVSGHMTWRGHREMDANSIPAPRRREMDQALQEHQGVDKKRWGSQCAPGHGVHAF